MLKFPSNEEFDVYLATQKKGEGAIAWEELTPNKIYHVTPAAVEVTNGHRYKLMDVVDAENQKISVWTPVDIYEQLIKHGVDSYFRALVPKIRRGKRKSTAYESVLLTKNGKMRCHDHSKSDAFVKEIRKNLRAAKQRKMETEKKKVDEACQTEEKKID